MMILSCINNFQRDSLPSPYLAPHKPHHHIFSLILELDNLAYGLQYISLCYHLSKKHAHILVIFKLIFLRADSSTDRQYNLSLYSVDVWHYNCSRVSGRDDIGVIYLEFPKKLFILFIFLLRDKFINDLYTNCPHEKSGGATEVTLMILDRAWLAQRRWPLITVLFSFHVLLIFLFGKLRNQIIVRIFVFHMVYFVLPFVTIISIIFYSDIRVFIFGDAMEFHIKLQIHMTIGLCEFSLGQVGKFWPKANKETIEEQVGQHEKGVYMVHGVQECDHCNNSIIYMLAGQKMMKPHNICLKIETVAEKISTSIVGTIYLLAMRVQKLEYNGLQITWVSLAMFFTKIFIFWHILKGIPSFPTRTEKHIIIGDSYVEEGYSESSFLFLKCFSLDVNSFVFSRIIVRLLYIYAFHCIFVYTFILMPNEQAKNLHVSPSFFNKHSILLRSSFAQHIGLRVLTLNVMRPSSGIILSPAFKEEEDLVGHVGEVHFVYRVEEPDTCDPLDNVFKLLWKGRYDRIKLPFHNKLLHVVCVLFACENIFISHHGMTNEEPDKKRTK
ncbi:hypothetical protein ACJX0J_009142, partial [Zea mays]